MSPYQNLIKNTVLLSSFPPEKLDFHIQNNDFRIHSYNRNCLIHLEGDLCTHLEIILSGAVAVERIDESGNLLTIAEFYKDDILGGNLLFSKNPYFPMASIAREDTVILEIEKNLLFDLLAESSSFLRTYLEFISDRTFILGDKLKHYVNKSIRECVLNYLEYESKIQNSSHVKLNMTKKALADRIGVQRTSLSRELAKMREDGIIVFDSKSITLL